MIMDKLEHFRQEHQDRKEDQSRPKQPVDTRQSNPMLSQVPFYFFICILTLAHRYALLTLGSSHAHNRSVRRLIPMTVTPIKIVSPRISV